MNDSTLRGLFYGAVIGAIAATWFTIGNGSWVTPSTLEQMITDATNQALTDAYADICYAAYQALPDRAQHDEQLQKFPVYQQREYISYRGWSVMPGSTRPFRDTSDECQERIAEHF